MSNPHCFIATSKPERTSAGSGRALQTHVSVMVCVTLLHPCHIYYILYNIYDKGAKACVADGLKTCVTDVFGKHVLRMV